MVCWPSKFHGIRSEYLFVCFLFDNSKGVLCIKSSRAATGNDFHYSNNRKCSTVPLLVVTMKPTICNMGLAQPSHLANGSEPKTSAWKCKNNPIPSGVLADLGQDTNQSRRRLSPQTHGVPHPVHLVIHYIVPYIHHHEGQK